MRQANDVLSVRSNARRSSDASALVIGDNKSVREALESLIARAGRQPRSFNSANEFLVRPRPISPRLLGIGPIASRSHARSGSRTGAETGDDDVKRTREDHIHPPRTKSA